ncbi:hypothetical protein EW145_g5687 [Phellinidium pouzarii]|uniref:U6 small nuclear RNA (adenine-(43)-N(6))-methyltransferase n=1 Tax=Phellinidium pouzarii TaxID=167371 RepID=A0A4S4KZ99_9AGAM|nr:hypothetical protein EW145_g5687 [Phellinidium pouzarii]
MLLSPVTMHERNPYRTPIDFISLAEAYPPLKLWLIKTANDSVTINFKDAAAQRCLTESLLSRDFELKLNLPEGRLCPPVPNRLNYLLWIQDLLLETFRSLPHSTGVVGIDIGTGSSAIYPLLGCRLVSSWNFVGTEIDLTSYASAAQNVNENGLKARIRILQVSPSDPLLSPLYRDPDFRYAFTMCNPPFYGSTAEVARSADGKALEPNAICTGADVEMVTPGGEEAFVQRMVSESLERGIGERCLWFTSMLGKLSSVGTIVSSLRAHEIDNYALTELVQGQTRRWVVAWSFTDVRLPDTLARALPSVHHALFPSPNTLRQPLRSLTHTNSLAPLSYRTLYQIVMPVLEGLDDVFVTEASAAISAEDSDDINAKHLSGDAFVLHVSAIRNTWSRAARRKKAKNVPIASGSNPSPGFAVLEPMAIDTSPALQTSISIAPALTVDIRAVYTPPAASLREKTYNRNSQKDGRNVIQYSADFVGMWALECTWRRGRERALFEGFWGYVCRRVGLALDSQATDI